MATADAKGPGDKGGDEHDFELGHDLELGADHDAAGVPNAEGERHDKPLETARLEFGDDEVRLPWLETDGDDEEEYQSYNQGQLVALIVLGLVALAVIGGGIWWAVSHRQEQVQVADGSVIPAPKEPYKEAPKNPGGKTFAGTGDTSFAVSEGQSRPAKLGQAETTKPVAEASPKPGAAAAPAVADAAGVGVQVAAYSNRTQAEAGWTKLSTQYDVLAGLHHRVVEGQADIGTVYRLQAVAGDAGAAHALCGKLKAAGLACQVKN